MSATHKTTCGTRAGTRYERYGAGLPVVWRLDGYIPAGSDVYIVSRDSRRCMVGWERDDGQTLFAWVNAEYLT